MTLGFLLGVFLRSLFNINFFSVLAIVFGGTFIFLASSLLEFHKISKYILLFILACSVGIVRTEFAYKNFNDGMIFKNGERVSFVGVVVDEVEKKDSYSVLHVAFLDGETNVKTIFRVNVSKYPEFEYGDVVEVEGVVKEPEQFVTDYGRIFDYKKYLMKDNIHYVLKYAKVKKTGEFKGSKFFAKLLSLKKSWLKSVSRLLPEPEASLAAGVILGVKSSLGNYWLDAFRKTGIVHIVVLSGYNLTLVANNLVRVVSFLPKIFGLGLGAFGVVLFAVIVGGGATVVRASIMAIIGMFASFINRPYLLLRALIFAGVFMVLWNPFVLVFDPGFQLSFLATLGLIFGSDYFKNKLSFITDKFDLREIVSATFATQLAVFPLLLYKIGFVSLIAPVVNVLVLPLVPYAMFFGFVSGLIGILNFYFALPLAFVAHILFSYMFFVVGFFAKFSFTSVGLPKLPWWSVLLFYIFISFLILKKKKPPNDF